MSNNQTTKLSDKIGEPAMLELMAEECSELAHASLKLARFMRDENPAPDHNGINLVANLEEEIADVYIILRELRKTDLLVDDDNISTIMDRKRKRMNERLGMRAESFIF